VSLGAYGGKDANVENSFVKTTDLQSIQSFIEVANRLINESDDKQTLHYNGGVVSFSRYGLGGEKLIISVKAKDGSTTATHVVNFDQFCLDAYIAVDTYVNFVQKFLEKQKAIKSRSENLELAEKQKEKLDLLSQRFRVENIQHTLSTLKKLLKSNTIPGSNIGFNYFRGQERKGKGNETKKKNQVNNSLVMELINNDNQLAEVQVAQEQARKMTDDAQTQKDNQADERAKMRQLKKEAMEREKESRTVILRKRVPGQQQEQSKQIFTIPVPETPEQIKEAKAELKKIRESEVRAQQIAAEEKAKKAEEKKQRKEEKRLFKEKERLNNMNNKTVVKEVPKVQQPVKEETKVVPKVVVPKVKTPEDLATEKREKLAEEKAEANRQKKKQVQLAKLAAEIEKKEKKQAQIEANVNDPKPVKEKKAPVMSNKLGKNKALTATKSQSSNAVVIGISVMMVMILIYFWMNM